MSVSLTPSDLETIRQLLKLAADNDLAELTVTVRDGVSISIKADEFVAAPLVAPARSHQRALPAPEPGAAPPPPVSTAATVPSAGRTDGIPMPSPMMGIYYGAATPGDPPFVKLGDTIKIGQIIGLIEAMKVFSEVPSEVAGRVVGMPVGNGELVQQNQPLLFVEAV